MLLVCPDFKPNLGGEAELAFRLSVALEARGHSVAVLAPPSPGTVPEDKILGDALVRSLDLAAFRSLNTIEGWLRWPVAMCRLIASLQRQMVNHRAEICLLASYRTWVVTALWVLSADYSLFLHGEDVTSFTGHGWIKRHVFLRACRRAKWIFFNSSYSRQLLLDQLPTLASRSEVVGCGVPTTTDWTTERREEARHALGWDDEIVILTIARLVMRKGIDTVIRSLPSVLRAHPDCRYVVVGEGPDRRALREMARELGVSTRVVMMGRIDEETKAKVYAASDVYVMVSYPGPDGQREGFGIAFLEANLHGLPVVGSRCGGIPDSVVHEGNGLLVEPRDPPSVSTAVLRLLDNPSLCQRLVEYGRRRIQERLNWDAISERVGSRLDAVSR